MKKIIIIDDDPGVQSAFSFVFDPQAYEVVIYPNGNSVLKNEFQLPDLFILDKQLSGVDGLDICRFLKAQQQTADIPVIMISASPNIYRLAEQAGADSALEKPFSLQALRQIVGKYI